MTWQHIWQTAVIVRPNEQYGITFITPRLYCDTIHHSVNFFFSIAVDIKKAMDELAKLMYTKVKGAGQVSLAQTSQRNDIQQLSDIILTPLMNLLNGRSVQVFPYAIQSNTLKKKQIPMVKLLMIYVGF